MNSTEYLPLQALHNNRRVDPAVPTLNQHAELLFTKHCKWNQQAPQSLKSRPSASHHSPSSKQDILLW